MIRVAVDLSTTHHVFASISFSLRTAGRLEQLKLESGNYFGCEDGEARAAMLDWVAIGEQSAEDWRR